MNVSFEVGLDRSLDVPKNSPVFKLTPSRTRPTLEEINSKILDAAKRRGQVLKTKVDQSNREVIKVKDAFDSRVVETTERKEAINLDMTIKSARREQILKDKAETARRLSLKSLMPRENLDSSTLSLNPDDLKRCIDEDIATKENNRRSYILGIKEHCKAEIDKVEIVRKRKEMQELNNSSII